MERPNTVSGLRAKRKELAELHAQLKSEAKQVEMDIGHVDACILLFDPTAKSERIGIERYDVKHRAPKGHMKRFLLDMFREAEAPITSRQIAAAWVADRGIDADDETVRTFRKRVSACIQTIRRDGLIEAAGYDGDCKLWILKRGDQ